MYRKTFTLKQHTPLIHFQHDQAGATLRATEVKPKLDRYIMDWFPKVQPTESSAFGPQIERVGNAVKKKANSPYQLTVDFNGSPLDDNYYLFDTNIKNDERDEISRELLYSTGRNDVRLVSGVSLFSERDKVKNGEWDKVKLGVQHREAPTVTVTSLYPGMAEMCFVALRGLFATENFGTRQSKGFGCFVGQDTVVAEMKAMLARRFVCAYELKDELEDDPTLILQEINKQYRKLRAEPGREGKKNVTKSELRNHFKAQPTTKIDWEKDLVTKELATQAGFIKQRGVEYKYIRALLGLSEHHEYPQVDDGVMVKIKHLPDQGQEMITRFRSPVRFKYCNGKLYLLADDSYEMILGKKFLFYVGKTPQSAGNRKVELSVPNDFSISDFFSSTRAFTNKWTRVK